MIVLQSPCDCSSDKYLKYPNNYLKAIWKLNAHPYQLFSCILHSSEFALWLIAGHHWTADTDSDSPSDGLWVSGSAPVFVELSGDFSPGWVLLLTKVCGRNDSWNMKNIYGWTPCKNVRKTLLLKCDLSALTVSTRWIELKFEVLMKKSYL